MEILKVSALNKVYVQGDKHIYAVHDAWLSVKKGEFTAVVGASGSSICQRSCRAVRCSVSPLPEH